MMKTQRINKLSYPDSIKIMGEALKKHRAIGSISDFMSDSLDRVTQEVNDLLYKTAKEKGMSLYDLCFHTIPEIGEPEIKIGGDMNTRSYSFEQIVRLVPVEFDLRHDGGYWKQKYFALKHGLQDLIDNKDDE